MTRIEYKTPRLPITTDQRECIIYNHGQSCKLLEHAIMILLDSAKDNLKLHEIKDVNDEDKIRSLIDMYFDELRVDVLGMIGAHQEEFKQIIMNMCIDVTLNYCEVKSSDQR